MRFINYTGITFFYGALRKAFILHNATLEAYDRKNHVYRKHPMLVSTKVGLMAASGLISIYMWPYYVYKDMNCFEIRLKGRHPEEYGYPELKSEVDYMFS